MLAGYDSSDGARGALRFAAAHLVQRPLVVAHAWRSPVRHTLLGQALARSHIDTFEEYAEAIDTIWGEVAAESAGEDAGFVMERQHRQR